MRAGKIPALTLVWAFLSAPVFSGEPPKDLMDAYKEASAYVSIHYDPQEALERLQKIIYKSPDWYEPYYLLASVYRMEGYPDEAQSVLSLYLNRHPVDTHALLGLAETYYASGKIQEALAALGRIPPAERSDPKFLYAQGLLAMSEGRISEAARWFQEASRSSKDPYLSMRARMGFLEALLREGKAEDAERALQGLLNVRPLSVPDRAEALAILERYPLDNAVLPLELARGIEAEGEDARGEHARLLGSAFLAGGEYEKAIYYLIRERERKKTAENALLLARAFVLAGAPESAWNYIEPLSADEDQRLRKEAEEIRDKSGRDPLAGKPSSGKPILEVPEGDVSFDVLKEGTPLEVSLLLRNAGNSDLVIYRISPSVTWITGSLSRNVLKGGETATVKAILKPRGVSGKTEVALQVYSNDLSRPVRKVTLAGTVEGRPYPVLVLLSPTDLGSVTKKKGKEVSIRVRNEGTAPFHSSGEKGTRNCLIVVPLSKELNPGEEGEVKIRFLPRRLPGNPEEGKVSLFGNLVAGAFDVKLTAHVEE